MQLGGAGGWEPARPEARRVQGTSDYSFHPNNSLRRFHFSRFCSRRQARLSSANSSAWRFKAKGNNLHATTPNASGFEPISRTNNPASRFAPGVPLPVDDAADADVGDDRCPIQIGFHGACFCGQVRRRDQVGMIGCRGGIGPDIDRADICTDAEAF